MFVEQNPHNEQGKGWIEVICGSMFSGKTEELIRRLNRVEIANQSYLLFKPKSDTRFSHEKIVSHSGFSKNAIPIESSVEVIQHHSDEKIVAFDEVQFMDGQIVQVVQQLANKGVRVIVSGLEMDFKGRPFGPMPQLMAVAEYVTKVHAICKNCGNLAQFSHRNSTDQNLVVLGEKDKYEPLCRSCFNQINA
ncbi:MAG: thymidine kinase [Crocinitomicaceae bacterium]|nr:thymidine kinase [Crocinitomicaceae bacterium]